MAKYTYPGDLQPNTLANASDINSRIQGLTNAVNSVDGTQLQSGVVALSHLTPTLAAMVVQSGALPTSPAAYQPWIDTGVTGGLLKHYTGSAWRQYAAPDVSATWTAPQTRNAQDTLGPGVSVVTQRLAPPSSLTATVATSGSVGANLAANTTYYYAVTAVAPDGTETVISNVASAAEGATPYPVNLSWTGSANAASYNVYRDTVNPPVHQLATGLTTTTYQDAGNVAPAAIAPPSVNLTGKVTAAGPVTGLVHVASGLTGATAASRYVGATTSGAPTTGTFAVGDFVIDQSGAVWVCTAAGTPGTWAKGGGTTTPAPRVIPLWDWGASSLSTTATGSNGYFLYQAGASTGASYLSPATYLFQVPYNWNNLPTYYFVAWLSTGNSSYYAHASLWDLTAGSILGSVATNSTTTTMVQGSASFAITPGHSYGVSLWSDSSSTYVYCSKAILVASS